MRLQLVLKHPSTVSSFIPLPLASLSPSRLLPFSLSPRYLFFDYAEEFKVVGVWFGFLSPFL